MTVFHTIHRIMPKLVDDAKAKALKKRRRSWPKEFGGRLVEATKFNAAHGLNTRTYKKRVPRSLRTKYLEGRTSAVPTLPKLKCLDEDA